VHAAGSAIWSCRLRNDRRLSLPTMRVGCRGQPCHMGCSLHRPGTPLGGFLCSAKRSASELDQMFARRGTKS
jgi:hypothetical protein